MVTTTAINRLQSLAAEAWLPRDRVAPEIWIADRVRLSEDYEGSRGSYKFQPSRPWWLEPAQAFANPRTRHIRIKAATQVGKTLFLIAIILYLSENSPATAMALVPDRDSAIEFRDRLYAAAIESGISVPPKWRWNTRHCDIGPMRVYLAWPSSRSRMRSRRCKYVFRTEVDVYQTRGGKDDPIEATDQRVKAFFRHAIVDESSPLPEPSRIDRLEQDTDQRRWWSCCPHCGTWQEVRFFLYREGDHEGCGGIDGLWDEHGNLRSPTECRATAFYRCLTGCEISEADRQAFVVNGRWVPRGCHVDRRGRLAGTPERDGQREVGYHLWAIHSHTGTWGTIAAEYVTAKRNGKLPNFFGNWLGLSYVHRGKTPEWQELGTRLAAAHSRGTVPAGAWFLTAGADVQDDEVYVTVRAWGDQRTSWLVDWYLFERSKGDEGDMVKSDLAQIESFVLRAVYPVVGGETNPRGRKMLGVALMCIDGQHRTMDVHEWRRSLGEAAQKRVRIVRGESGIKEALGYKQTIVEHTKRDEGKIYEGGLELWNINPEIFRTDLAQRFRSDPTKPGAWYVTADVMEQGEFYLRQVVNEPMIMVRDKSGRWKKEWRERDSTIGHDYWDTEVYSSAGAQMVVDEMDGSPGWDSAKWPKPPAKPGAGGRKKTAGPAVGRDFE